MNTHDNHYLKILFTWEVQSFKIETENGETIPVFVNGYWEGIVDSQNNVLQSCVCRDVISIPDNNVFNKGIYSLKTLESVPKCIYAPNNSRKPTGLKDGRLSILIAIGDEGVVGKEVTVKDGKIDIDITQKERFLSLSDEFFKRVYYSCVPIDTVIKVMKDASLIGEAMKILMDTHTSIYDESGNPFYMHALKVALACETPNQIQVALLHETVEDDQYTYDELYELGFSDDVITASAAISQGIDEDFESYIARCSQNPLASYVKIRELRPHLIKILRGQGRFWARDFRKLRKE